MGWFKGKKGSKGGPAEDETTEAAPDMPERQKSKLVHATSTQNFASLQSPAATVVHDGSAKPTAPSPQRPPLPPSAAPANGPQVLGANLPPISTTASVETPATTEIEAASPVQGATADATAASSLSSSQVFESATANGVFKPKDAPKGKGSYVQQQQQRILELEDEVVRLQTELSASNAARTQAEEDLHNKTTQVQSLMKQLTDLSNSSPNSKGSGGLEGEANDNRSTDDLNAALKAFREQSQSKLADTLRQNQELRHQVENYEAMCRTIGEVLRDYEWLQQCRIVTGDLDLGRLRKSMMKLWHSGKTRAVLPVLAMVLAFGPDDVQRCRSVISTAKQEADMVDYIPEIIEHNMDENMKRDAITIYIEAHKSQTEDTDIAMYLTDKFAEKYKGEWHCVVGEQYALSSCYESKVIKFKSGHRSVILWSN